MSDLCDICGLSISRGNVSHHVGDVEARAEQGRGAWFLTLNTEMLARGARDPEYWALLKKADVITADGMPLVWASKFKFPNACISDSRDKSAVWNSGYSLISLAL